jgi:hypothetical protein
VKQQPTLRGTHTKATNHRDATPTPYRAHLQWNSFNPDTLGTQI